MTKEEEEEKEGNFKITPSDEGEGGGECIQEHEDQGQHREEANNTHD